MYLVGIHFLFHVLLLLFGLAYHRLWLRHELVLFEPSYYFRNSSCSCFDREFIYK